MEMLNGGQIAAADLSDWRKLGQGLHARYLLDGFAAGARFLVAVGEAGDALGHHPRVSLGRTPVDLELVSDDAIYRDGEGTEYIVEWVTQLDLDLAGRVTEIAAEHQLDAGRVPNLWFGDADERETAHQRFHVEVYVAPEVAEQRIAAALAAGGTVVDDSNAPSLTVIADQDGNRGVVCVDLSAAKQH